MLWNVIIKKKIRKNPRELSFQEKHFSVVGGLNLSVDTLYSY